MLDNERRGKESIALLWAASNGHERLVDHMVQHGAETNVQDSHGSTALMWAAQNGHERVVDLLIRHGADVNLPRSNGFTALRGAAVQDHPAVARETCTTDGKTALMAAPSALMAAASRGHAPVVELLVERGAELDVQDSNGHTALTRAAYHGNTAIVLRLLLAGADATARTVDGMSALQIAEEQGHAECITALLIKEQNAADGHIDGIIVAPLLSVLCTSLAWCCSTSRKRERADAAALEGNHTPAEDDTSPSVEPSPISNEEEPPDQFVCPITTEVMTDPVMAADGQSYERSAIERWLTTKQTSPLTGGELEHSYLVPNHLLRRHIREWQEAR